MDKAIWEIILFLFDGTFLKIFCLIWENGNLENNYLEFEIEFQIEEKVEFNKFIIDRVFLDVFVNILRTVRCFKHEPWITRSSMSVRPSGET